MNDRSRNDMLRDPFPAVFRLFPAIFIVVPRTGLFDRQLSSLFFIGSLQCSTDKDERSLGKFVNCCERICGGSFSCEFVLFYMSSIVPFPFRILTTSEPEVSYIWRSHGNMYIRSKCRFQIITCWPFSLDHGRVLILTL